MLEPVHVERRTATLPFLRVIVLAIKGRDLTTRPGGVARHPARGDCFPQGAAHDLAAAGLGHGVAPPEVEVYEASYRRVAHSGTCTRYGDLRILPPQHRI